MGGSGSTRWNWYSKRWTAEDCLKLSIFDLRRLFGAAVFAERQPRASLILWSRRDGSIRSSIGYDLIWKPTPQITLRYTPSGASQAVVETIKLQSTPCHYGGERWWYTCPMCERRVGVLYYRQAVLMRGGEWACRHCHDLTYTSTQEAHVLDRGGGPYKAYCYALDRLWKAEAKARKHHWGRKAEKAWQSYIEAAERVQRIAGVEQRNAEERYQKLLDRINVLE